jgi:hypothetical protein
MDALRAEGWFAAKMHGNKFTMAGLPDILCVAEGYYFGLETKHPETINDTSASQDLVHGKIRAAGGFAAVVYTPQQAVHVVKTRLAELRSC